VTKVLDDINVGHQIFYHVTPDPTLECINEGLKEMLEFRPDVIIAMGGGSPMDAAKVRETCRLCMRPNTTCSTRYTSCLHASSTVVQGDEIRVLAKARC
jgi:glycerol dehydrogenase-like iron-containing ADH family enzyme